MSVFPWATFRTTKSAVKMHTLIDIRTHIPTFISITEASVADVNIWEDEEFVLEKGSWYIVDRGYIAYEQYYRMTQSGCFFVTRAKNNTAWKRLYSKKITPEDRKA